MSDRGSGDRASRTSEIRLSDALQVAGAVRDRYQMDSLTGFLESCLRFAQDNLLNIAVLGRCPG